MLFSHSLLNPAVARHADLMTDRLPSDTFLRDVAAMHGLPLLIERTPDAAPSTLDLAERAVASAEANHAAILSIYRSACARLGEANATRHPPLTRGGVGAPVSAAARRRAQRDAMAWINSRHVLMRAATKRLDAARAALLALAS